MGPVVGGYTPVAWRKFVLTNKVKTIVIETIIVKRKIICNRSNCHNVVTINHVDKWAHVRYSDWPKESIMRLLESARLVVALDSGRFDDGRIEELSRKIEPILDRLSEQMRFAQIEIMKVLARERDLNGEKFVSRVFEE